MRIASGIALVLGLLAVSAQAREGETHQLNFAGAERSYKLFVPDGAPKTPLPLMIVMHGGLGNADETDAPPA